MKELSIFGKRLRHFLSLRNVTQEELAEHLGISRQAVSLWCNGKGNPKMAKIEAICEYLNITKTQLLSDEDDDLAEKIRMLSEEDKKIIEGMIDRMMGK